MRMFMGIHTKRPEGLLRALIHIAVFALVIPYYEIVFNLSTAEKLFTWGTPIMLLFSLAYGLLAYLIVSFIKNRKANYIVSIVLIAVLTLPYLVQYFVYSGFKSYYTIAYMVGGAEDMIGGYMGETIRVVCSWDGLLKILLFSLPAVLFGVFGRCLYHRNSFPWRGWIRGAVAATTVLCYCTGLLMIHGNPTALAVYKTNYDYASSIQRFGLLTSMGLDVRYLANGKDISFEKVPELEGPLLDSSPSHPTMDDKPVVYADNVLELNLSGGNDEIQKMNDYIASLTPSKKNAFTGMFKDKNLIMFTAEAFSAEVIDPELTPTLYRLATKGIQFKDYYQPAGYGTTGGEYQHIFGMLAVDKAFEIKTNHYNYMTMGSQLDRLGYYGKAYHNNDYTYYSRHVSHNNLGYSDGFMGYGNGMEEYVANRWPQSDYEMVQGTLPAYIDKEKFNIYYMTVSGHSGYEKTGNSMTARNWDAVKDLPYSDEVKGYLAANLELEKALAHLVEQLEAKGIADDTVICLTADHFPYGLSDPALAELYGTSEQDIKNRFVRDHSSWILWSGCLEDMEPIVVTAPTSSLDILPTLSNLFGTEFDSRLFPGRDALSGAEAVVFYGNGDWKTQYGTYYAADNRFVATEGVETPDGYVQRMKVIVKNKIDYCIGSVQNDYFRYLFEK